MSTPDREISEQAPQNLMPEMATYRDYSPANSRRVKLVFITTVAMNPPTHDFDLDGSIGIQTAVL